MKTQRLTTNCTVTGTLKGYDQLMNLVLDNVKETTRGTWLDTLHSLRELFLFCFPSSFPPPPPPPPPSQSPHHHRNKLTRPAHFADEDGNTSTRNLGLLVARGTLLVLISPVDGSEEIANPFVQADEEGEEEA
jgi:U6 snRNA-associated Sm-like protein LSm7